MKKLLLSAVLLIILGACSRHIVPYYTDVSKISELRTGLTVSDVNQKLGITPHDVYYLEENNSVLVYYYRHKQRKMLFDDEYDKHNELSQTKGDTWYKDPAKVYVYFIDKKVKSFITDRGREKSKYVVIAGNNIMTVNKDQLNNLIYPRDQKVYYITKDGELKLLDVSQNDQESKNNVFLLTKEPVKEKKSFFKSIPKDRGAWFYFAPQTGLFIGEEGAGFGLGGMIGVETRKGGRIGARTFFDVSNDVRNINLMLAYEYPITITNFFHITPQVGFGFISDSEYKYERRSYYAGYGNYDYYYYYENYEGFGLGFGVGLEFNPARWFVIKPSIEYNANLTGDSEADNTCAVMTFGFKF